MADNSKNTEQERKPFEVHIDEHYDFDGIASTKFITSIQFCKMVSDLLHGIFSDFEGCMFEPTAQGMEPTIALVFNHDDHTGSELPCAVERAGSGKSGSSIIDRGRARDFYNRNGDRFILTDDGQDFVKTIIVRRLIANGKIDFKNNRNIVGEFVEPSATSNFYFQQQYVPFTKVSFISISRICQLLFGSGEENGDNVEYIASVTAPFNNGFGGYNKNSNYILSITKVSAKEINDFCGQIGLSMQSYNIIR